VNTHQNGVVTDAAERLRRRYPPPRLPRPVLVLVIGLVVAVGLAWLIWAGLFHSRPAVSGRVSGFSVVSDTAIDVTLTVQRREPARRASCRVVAQASDSRTVGEQQVPVEAGGVQLVDVRVRLITVRRAIGATVQDCRLE
jgi:hypothetical protein